MGVVSVMFIAFAGGLLGYHTFLILSGQTTWEHAKRKNIDYLKIYGKGLSPFDKGVCENMREVLMHGGKVQDWELPNPH